MSNFTSSLSITLFYMHLVLSYTVERFAMYAMVAYTLYDIYHHILLPTYAVLAPYEYTILFYLDICVTFIRTAFLFGAIYEMMQLFDDDRKKNKTAVQSSNPLQSNPLPEPVKMQIMENPIIY